MLTYIIGLAVAALCVIGLIPWIVRDVSAVNKELDEDGFYD